MKICNLFLRLIGDRVAIGWRLNYYRVAIVYKSDVEVIF